MRGSCFRQSRKGFFYTLLSLLFLGIIILSVFYYQGAFRYQEKSQLHSTRVLQMDNLLRNLDHDIGRAIYISSFHSFLAMQERIVKSGHYIPDIDSAFAGLFLNGTLGAEPVSSMQGSTINDWFAGFNQQASVNGIRILWTVSDVVISHSDPWHVRASIVLDYVLTDSADTASWNLSRNFSAELPIAGFEDPLYLIETSGKVSNIIHESNVTDFVQGTDVSNLRSHLLNSWYTESDHAPSYLQRLEGDFSASMFGIESMVDLQKLSDQGIATQEKSVIDYIYFSDQNPAFYAITGMPDWFRLDDGSIFQTTRLDYYEVDELVQ